MIPDTYQCFDCKDDASAWESLWCEGHGEHRQPGPSWHIGMKSEWCGRSSTHGPHVFCVRCHCHRADWREVKRKAKAA